MEMARNILKWLGIAGILLDGLKWLGMARKC